MIKTHEEFYDQRVQRNIEAFLTGNKRIFSAWNKIHRFASQGASPKKIIDFGCGIGESSWRASLVWNDAEILGVDPSAESISAANKIFASEQVRFRQGSFDAISEIKECDLFFMIDVIEHVQPEEYSNVFEAIRKTLSSTSTLVLTFPSPGHLDYLRVHNPSEIQPIDESIDLKILERIAEETETILVNFEFVSIWKTNDYAHAVFKKQPIFQPTSAVQPRSFSSRLIQKLSTIVSTNKSDEIPDSLSMRRMALSKSEAKWKRNSERSSNDGQ